MTTQSPLAIEEILLLHHSHLDVGYTHSQPILWALQKEYVSQVLDWLELTADLSADHQPKWTCEVTEPVLRWLRGASGADAARFQRLYAVGRIGLGALRWHTAGLADRAGLRRLLDGKDELEQFLGGPIQVACQHDVNGASWVLADELLDAGVDLFVMAVNPHLGRPLESRPGMFLWEAPSGRRLRVFNGHHYTMFDQLLYTWDDSVDRMAEGWTALESHLERRGYGLDFVYLTSTASPAMWDNAPPNPYLPDLIQRWNAAERGPRVRYATFDDLRKRALAVPEESLPVLRGDWTDYWANGYASTPIATAVNQRAKPLLAAAELIAGESEHSSLQQARDDIDLYDEHTWGYFDTRPGHPQAQTGEILKLGLAHQGHELASFALMDGLERLAGNPIADKGIKGVLLCNPSPHTVKVRPTVPAAWLSTPGREGTRTYRASRMFYDQQSWGTAFPGAESVTYEPVELPPYSWRRVSLDRLSVDTARPGVTHHLESKVVERWELNTNAERMLEQQIGVIESPFHTLRYNPATGRILSLVDREQARELLDVTSSFDLFALVRERTDELVEPSRYAFYERDLDREKFDLSCWHPWSPIRERATRLITCAITASTHTITVERHFEAPGTTRLVQRISLRDDDPVISLDVELELLPEESPQSFYFALPLAMGAGWEAAYDSAGQLVRMDADQVPGACRNWVASDSFAAVSGESGCVALLTPDAPLVQFGDFHFGPPLDSLPRPENPLLLAWPVNNYWDTNFARQQPGLISLRYGLLSTPEGEWDSVRRLARSFRAAPLQWPVTSAGAEDGSGTLNVPGSQDPSA